jgi:hypothetical protein
MTLVSVGWFTEGVQTHLTGIPELVLMPAPVITTTFLAFHSVFAISCSSGSQPGSTCVVGILHQQVLGSAFGMSGTMRERSHTKYTTRQPRFIVPCFGVGVGNARLSGSLQGP